MNNALVFCFWLTQKAVVCFVLIGAQEAGVYHTAHLRAMGIA
jgi:hypothetical protein